ncbi:hypothetical protein AMECASPLE_018722 [Ameca splendens]|uniref:Uncharacterized protein n=1 Tax=Ameca splendens TaxID=208324 RepID=A0ABV0Z1G0_9TELE
MGNPGNEEANHWSPGTEHQRGKWNFLWRKTVKVSVRNLRNIKLPEVETLIDTYEQNNLASASGNLLLSKLLLIGLE